MKKIIIGLALVAAIAAPACGKQVTVTDEGMKALEILDEGGSCTARISGIDHDIPATKGYLLSAIPVEPIFEEHGIPLNIYTCTS